jgi:hypothetical protein
MQVPPATKALLGAAIAWNLAWKGASLWRAARNESRPWFVTLLVTNTLGLLDAVYLFGVDRHRRDDDRTERAILTATGEPPQLGHASET